MRRPDEIAADFDALTESDFDDGADGADLEQLCKETNAADDVETFTPDLVSDDRAARGCRPRHAGAARTYPRRLEGLQAVSRGIRRAQADSTHRVDDEPNRQFQAPDAADWLQRLPTSASTKGRRAKPRKRRLASSSFRRKKQRDRAIRSATSATSRSPIRRTRSIFLPCLSAVRSSCSMARISTTG